MGLTITLLGEVTVFRTGDEVGGTARLGSTPQVRMAFAMLALGRHQGVTRDALAESLWPEGLPPTWRSSLRTVVSRARAFVGRAVGDDADDLLVTRDGSYRLRLPPDTVVDLEAAEAQVAAAVEDLAAGRGPAAHKQAQEAAERLRLPFLPEHHGEWIEARRAQQTQTLLIGLEVASRAACLLGDPAGAVAAAAEAIDRAPRRESAHRCLMAAHAASGNRAEAVHAYQRLRRTLAEELGLDPHEETERAYIALLGPAPAPAPGSCPRDEHPARSSPFVGRPRELAEARAAWDQVLATRTSRLVVVAGEAGVGKSRLATEFAALVSGDGPLVLFGRSDPDVTAPYQPFVEALDVLVARSFRDRAAGLSASECAELAAVFPSFAAGGFAGRAGHRALLFDTLTRAVEEVAADHPLLVVLDDCQWADGDSALLLRHLLRHARASRLMVLALLDGDPAADRPFGETVHALSRDGQVTHLPLGGLDDPACRELVRGMRPDAPSLLAAVPRLVADTAGNPFLLIESIRAHDERAAAGGAEVTAWSPPGAVSPELDTFVSRRVDRLSRPARTLLVAASVAGGAFELDVVAEAAELDRSTVLDALEEALAAGLVVDARPEGPGGAYRFSHTVVRRTLYHRLSRARRLHLHERVADAIEDAPGGVTGANVVLLAHHRGIAAQPRGDVRAVRCALAAAVDARAAAAPTEAVQWYRRALDHVAPGDVALRAEVLTDLGLARAELGDAEGPSTLFDAALRARGCGRIDTAARAALGLADLARRQPHLRPDAAALIEDLLGSDPPDPSAGGARLSRLAWARLVTRRYELDHGPGNQQPTNAATAAAMLRRELRTVEGPEHLEERRSLAEDLRIAARATFDPGLQLEAHHHLAMVAAITGDGATAATSLRRMGEAIEAGGGPSGAPYLDEWAVTRAVVEGRFADLGGAEAPAGGTDVSVPGIMVDHQRVVARWLRGDLHRPGRDGAPRGDDLPLLAPVEQALVDLASGDHGAAHIVVRELSLGERPLPPGDAWLHAAGLAGLAAVDLDDPAVALDLYARLLPHSRLVCGVGYRSFVGTVAFHLGRLAMVAGCWAEAEQHLVRALHQLAGMKALPWMALTQDALARVLAARGRPSDHDTLVALRSEARWLARTLGLRTSSGLAGDGYARTRRTTS